MLIRLHFTRNGEPVAPLDVVSHSSRLVGATRNGRVELTVLPQDSGTWERRAAAARIREHRPLLEQLEALATLVDRARRPDALAAATAAQRNAAILARARALADSLGDTAVAAADSGVRRIERETQRGIDQARAVIRRHPLRSIGFAALACAVAAALWRR